MFPVRKGGLLGFSTQMTSQAYFYILHEVSLTLLQKKSGSSYLSEERDAIGRMVKYSERLLL